MSHANVEANYTALSSFFAKHPDALAIRRFRKLQIRSLLLFQAELTHLEAELEEIERHDAQQRFNPLDRANSSWTAFTTSEVAARATSSGPPTNLEDQKKSEWLYREKVLQIRRTLQAYSMCQCRQSHETQKLTSCQTKLSRSSKDSRPSQRPER